MNTTRRGQTDGWHIDAGDEWRQPRVLDWHGSVVAVLPAESDKARLIAAAPELFDALKKALLWTDEENDVGEWREFARAAIVAALPKASEGDAK